SWERLDLRRATILVLFQRRGVLPRRPQSQAEEGVAWRRIFGDGPCGCGQVHRKGRERTAWSQLARGDLGQTRETRRWLRTRVHNAGAARRRADRIRGLHRTIRRAGKANSLRDG